MNEGTLTLDGNKYVLDTKPHVRMTVKRLFLGCTEKEKKLTFKRTPDTTENLLWVLERWPHECAPGLLQAMQYRAGANRELRNHAAEIMAGTRDAGAPTRWNPAFPLRPYQAQMVALARMAKGFLCGDDLGLGKTAMGVGVIADHPGPALVVCQPHLPQQWAEQVKMFCPELTTHIVKTGTHYEMPPHDVTICPYSKLLPWAESRPWRTVIYDEVQELRHADTDKHRAARALTDICEIRVGLSATPVVNNAGEMFNIMGILSPGTCGTAAEFQAEWGSHSGNKYRVNDPEALGAWLRSQGVYIRRTRKQAGRELKPLHSVNHVVPHDPRILDRLREKANHLAAIVLAGGFHQKGVAARQLDILLRQTTGIAKALPVADFVAELVRRKEKVLLAGWHREVYDIWQREFDRLGIKSVLYTGSETPAGKRKTKEAFVNGDAKVMIMSLRSGAGLDGLQHVCRTVVFGELDWSPKIMEQVAGRVHRDGQKKECTRFNMISDAGSDPIVSVLLAGKWEQSTAVTDPELLKQEFATAVPEGRMAELAKAWLSQQNPTE